MSEGPRPGSRSERHQRRGARGRRESAGGPPAADRQRVPVIEPLRPEPARSERRAQQRVGRRRQRTRISIALVVVIALVVAAAGAAIYRRHRKAATTSPHVKARTQRTLLLEIPSPDGDAIASALFATDPATGNASIVLVPARMLSQVPGFGSASFGEALKFGGAQLANDTLANQLGVIIDDGWVATQADLAALVDGVAGVDVEVDTELPGGKESSDVVLRPGQQHLGGQAAAAFATYGIPGQPELGRLTRFQLVLAALLDKLPKKAAQITPLVPVPKRQAGSTATRPDAIAQSLQLLAQARAVQQLTYKPIPVIDIDNGSDTETTRADPDQLAALVQADLAGSVPANDFRPDNRIVVRNGVGTAGVGQSVTRRLNAAGFSVVQTGNADNFDYKLSQVLIFDSGDRAVSEGEAVAAALGLLADRVEVSVDQQSVADVIVTIGADYVPTPPAG